MPESLFHASNRVYTASHDGRSSSTFRTISFRDIARVAVVALVCAVSATSFANDGTPGSHELDDSVKNNLDALLARDATESDYDDLVRLCLIRHGELAPLVEQLKGVAAKEDVSDALKKAALRAETQVHWRDGQLRLALECVEQLDSAEQPSSRVRDRLDHALLLDASGRSKEATTAYRALLPALKNQALLSRLRIRLALMESDAPEKDVTAVDGETAEEQASGEPKDATTRGGLAQYAAEPGRGRIFRNRAAIVLGILGEPQQAIDLFTVDGEGSQRFRRLMRMTEWAIDAGLAAQAQTLAWEAMETATLNRDRRYALTTLVEAYRVGDGLQALIDRFASTPALDDSARQTWIDLLRETGQIEEALRLFRDATASNTFTTEMRRQLLEMCRESGRDDTLVGAYRELIAAEPKLLEWREGLARHFLERGAREEAMEVWRPLLANPDFAPYRLDIADAIGNLGLDEMAISLAEEMVANDDRPVRALLFLFQLYKSRGEMKLAEEQLERIDVAASPDSADRMVLSEGFEQIGRLDRAVDILKGVREARGEERAGEDLEMRLAWLLSEVGEEDEAMDQWQALWHRVDSLARRRYVEDRLMTVAARIGRLADIAIELEERLLEGVGTERDAGLLIRLYQKANDPVSAAEVIEEYMVKKGSSTTAILQEKARVYLACNDFHNFEEVMADLIEIDDDNRVDHLRQLAMSKLERGKPDEAREVLESLRKLEGTAVGSEFEAGVLALSGLRNEAVAAYRTGIAQHPDRIEIHLLIGNVLRDLDQTNRATAMFQYLAEHADGDDLFTIAIDGLLNMRAPAPVLKWARRITLERLTQSDDKMYLYQLVADLSEEIDDNSAHLAALEAALPIAGERRSSVLRELMELARAGGKSSPYFSRVSGKEKDKKDHLSYGRRLIGLREVIPPQVYLELGEAFLANNEVTNAAKTFQLATDVPDYVAFQRQIAGSFESARYFEESLRTYERLLVGESTNIPLLTKVAELQEQLGHDEVASRIYAEAIELLLARRPSTDDTAEETDDAPDDFWANRNIDEFSQYFDRVLRGLIVTLTDEIDVDHLIREGLDRLNLDLAAATSSASDASSELRIDAFPRLRDRASYLRQLATPFARHDVADRADVRLVRAFPNDLEFVRQLVKERMDLGRVESARRLVEDGLRDESMRKKIRYLTGSGAISTADTGVIPVNEVTRFMLPLLVSGRRTDAIELMQRGDYGAIGKEDLDGVSMLFAAASLLGDQDLVLTLGRHWINAAITHGRTGRKQYEIETILQKCRGALDPKLFRSLAQSFVSVILDENKIEDGRELLPLLPGLQQRFDEPLIDADDIVALIEKRVSGQTWGVGPILELVPSERRTSLIRAIWPNIPKTARASFVIDLVGGLQETVPTEFADLLVDAMAEAIEDADDKESLRYWIDSLLDSKANADLSLRIVQALSNGLTSHPSIRLNLAYMKLRNGDDEAGLNDALSEFEQYLGNVSEESRDWETDSALDRIYQLSFPLHQDRFLAVVDKVESANGASESLSQQRLDLIGRSADPAALLEATELESKKHPDSIPLLQRLERAQTNAGLQVAALATMRRILDQEEDANQKKRYRDRLALRWEAMRHPINALAAMEMGEAEDAEKEPPSDEGKKAPRATIVELKRQIEDGDLDAAQLTLRRLWRGESPVASNRVATYYVGGVRRYGALGYLPETWPKDPDPDQATKKWSRGGLPETITTDPNAESDDPPAVNTFDVLLDYDFGRDELERKMRVMSGQELSRSKNLFEAIADDVSEREGADVAFRKTWEKLRDGAGGRREHALLLALLEASPEAVDGGTESVLRDILTTVDPGDGHTLMRLAGSLAKAGDPDAATELYRWCATQSDAGGRVIFYDDSRIRLSGQELIRAVSENLEGEKLVDVIEKILAWANPGDDEWMRESYEALVLTTWAKLLPPKEALARCRELCEHASEPTPNWRRTTARLAAGLYAASGEVDDALRCLTASVAADVSGDPSFRRSVSVVNGMVTMQYGAAENSLSTGDLMQLFPWDLSQWDAPQRWFEGASALLIEATTDGRLNGEALLRALVIITIRQQQLSLLEEAKTTLHDVAARAEGHDETLLWIADAARLVDEPDLAFQLERNLLDRGILNPERIADVITYVAEREGVDAALKIGDQVTEYSLPPAMLDRLVELATRAGDDAHAGKFAQLRDAAADATAKIEAEREAIRAAKQR